MISAKGYAAQSATEPLGPYSFTRRDLRHHDVQIEILYCGVCHSDLHTVRSEWGPSTYPCVPGHEIVGRVKAVGDHVKKYKMGDLVGVGCLVDSCRECKNCKQGLEQYCINGATFTYNGKDKIDGTNTLGGYSNVIVTDESFILLISDRLPLEGVAPLLCAG